MTTRPSILLIPREGGLLHIWGGGGGGMLGGICICGGGLGGIIWPGIDMFGGGGMEGGRGGKLGMGP